MNIVRSTVPKYSVRITINEMWRNFMAFVTDIGPQNSDFDLASVFKQVHSALFTKSESQESYLLQLFKDGFTPFLLGQEAMDKFGVKAQVYCEVIILGENGGVFLLIDNEFIQF